VGAADHFGVVLHSPPSDLEELIFGFDDEPNQNGAKNACLPICYFFFAAPRMKEKLGSMPSTKKVLTSFVFATCVRTMSIPSSN
jgi:hypothetical protein